MTKLTLTLAAVLSMSVAAVPAQAAEDAPPLSSAKCEFKLKKRHPLERVLRHGLKVKVTCDGPATVDVMADFAQGKQDNDWIDLHPGGVPGISTGPPAVLESAGTATLTCKLLPKKFMRRYAKTRLTVLFGKERLDRPGVYRAVGGTKIVLVR